jgi:hypothetical protein
MTPCNRFSGNESAHARQRAARARDSPTLYVRVVGLLGESAEPLAFFPTQICHGHSSATVCNLRVRYRMPAPTRDRNGALRFRTHDVKGLGTQVAAKMLPDGTKALAPSNAAVVGQEFQADPVALGQVAVGLLDLLPVMRHATAEYTYLRQSVRTNNAAVVAVRYLAPRAADLL